MSRSSANSEKIEIWSLNEIKNLIGIINRNRIYEFELEQGNMKIHIVTRHSKGDRDKEESKPVGTMVPMIQAPVIPGVSPGLSPVPTTPFPGAAPERTAPTDAEPEKPPVEEKKEEENLEEIKSPMVGTFYRAPSPESPPYVQLGDKVNADSVLCIVEAMKLMNEIKAEMNGTVMDILVENGQPVEYGQPMFKIRPA